MEWQEFFHRVADEVFRHEEERQAAHELISSESEEHDTETIPDTTTEENKDAGEGNGPTGDS